jgi:hypothetical protein
MKEVMVGKRLRDQALVCKESRSRLRSVGVGDGDEKVRVKWRLMG